MVPEELRRALGQRYPRAKRAQLKASGDFPFLSDPEEVTLFIEVHMLGLGVVRGIASHIPNADLEEERRKQPSEVRQTQQESQIVAPSAASSAPAAAPARKIWKNPFEDDDDL